MEQQPVDPAAEAGRKPILSAGDVLGKYRVQRLLAQGGMGDVYLATDETLGRGVALKVLSRKLTDDRKFVARFRREARSAAAISHANVVAIYEIGPEDAELQYFAMEYVPGETLEGLLNRRGRLHPSTALRYAEDAAKGLDAAASLHIIHRDIKPGNILIPEKGPAKLTDFGLARALEDVTRLTNTDVIVGTPHYVSPEQARGEEHIDHRADIYSLGVTLYHALSGKLPFHAATPMGIMLRHVNDPLPPLGKLCPDLPPAVVNVVHCMLEKAPANRYQTYDEVIAAMEAARGVAGEDPSAVGQSGAKLPKAIFSTPTLATPTGTSTEPSADDDRDPLGVTKKRTVPSSATTSKLVTTSPYPGVGGLLLCAWRIFANPTKGWDQLARSTLSFWPPTLVGLLSVALGAPLAYGMWQNDKGWHVRAVVGLLVFLATDLALIMPVYAWLAPRPFRHGRWLAAYHLVLFSWPAQVFFAAKWLFVIAFPTPWIAYTGMERLLELEGGALTRGWLLCLAVFALRCAIAISAAVYLV